MAIHKNDDYEKLAKLFYPSIEASGNVYYGQTRKLTMDEVLGKNDFGFESHIESFRVDDDNEDYGFKYINCLCWKLGPLSDTITLDDDNYPLEGMYGYAKYKLIVSDNTRNNLLYSNNFNTYEKNVRIELLEVSRIEDGKAPYGNDPYDGRCFYVQNAPDLENYLYIPITLDHFEESDSDDEGSSGGDIHIRGPLYIKAVEGSLAVKIAPSHGFSQEEINNLSGVYLYKVGNDQDWQEITDFENDEIHLSQNQFVYFRCTNDRFIPEFTNQKFIQFLIEDLGNDSKAEVGGSLNSIRQYASPYGYFGLFRFCDTIVSAENLIIDNVNGAAKGYCAEMFLGCTNLVKPPRSISTVAELSHRAMFKNCSSLIRSPILAPVKVALGCYFEMFDGCTSLTKLWCSAKSIYIPRELHIQDPRLDMAVGPYIAQSNVPALPSINVGSWLDNASQTGNFYCTNNVPPVGRPRPIELPDYWEDLVPEGWSPKAFNSAEFFNEEVAETPTNEDQNEDELPFTPKYKRDYLITSGSASDDSYGRGNVTKKSTLYNMKTINPLFDADAPNTGEYSIDGSYNQDVWGWKCFNGPVSFRNGIYGENASLITDQLDYLAEDEISHTASSILLKEDDNKAKITLAVSENNESYVDISADYINFNGTTNLGISYVTKASKLVNENDTEEVLLENDDDHNILARASVLPFDRGVDLGDENNPFGCVYSGNSYVSVLESLHDDDSIALSSKLIPNNAVNDITLGDNDNIFSKIYTQNIIYTNDDSIYTKITENSHLRTAIYNQSNNLISYYDLSNQHITEHNDTYLYSICNIKSNPVIESGSNNIKPASVKVTYKKCTDGSGSDNSFVNITCNEFTVDSISTNLEGIINVDDTLKVHNLEVVNKEVDDNIELGSFICHGPITTYQIIKPAVRNLRLVPSLKTVFALNNSVTTDYNIHLSDQNRSDIRDHIANCQSISLYLDEIINAFIDGNDYVLPDNIELSDEDISILEGPDPQLNITNICNVQSDVDNLDEEISPIIGLASDLAHSYNGYFNSLFTNKLITEYISNNDESEETSSPSCKITFNIPSNTSTDASVYYSAITTLSISSLFYDHHQDIYIVDDNNPETHTDYHFTNGAIWPVYYVNNEVSNNKANMPELGSNNYRWKTIYAYDISAKGVIKPYANCEADLGENGCRFDNAYVNILHVNEIGNIPSNQYIQGMPEVGTIFLGRLVSVNDVGENILLAGSVVDTVSWRVGFTSLSTEITTDGEPDKPFLCERGLFGSRSVLYAPFFNLGKYRLLSNAWFCNGGSHGAICLMQRVSDDVHEAFYYIQ